MSPNKSTAKVLSIRQPWATLIVAGIKPVENRSWPTRYRGPLYIHASSRFDDEPIASIEQRLRISIANGLPTGGIIGIVDLVDCVETHPSRFYARGHWAFVLANPRRVKFHAMRGQLGLFSPPQELVLT
jgi:hypothetical protein